MIDEMIDSGKYTD